MKVNKQFITKEYTSSINHQDLDMISDVLGDDYDEYKIIQLNDGDFYSGEATPIKIDQLIKSLNYIKESGANYVEVFHHNDHSEYYLHGIKVYESTLEEIQDFTKDVVKKSAVDSKISELQAQIERLKRLKHED